MYTTQNRFDLGPYLGPRELRALPVHRWFTFPHSFGATLVRETLSHLGARSGESIWDPFVGAGTSLVVAREMGLQGFGSDLLPIATVASRAKTRSYHIGRLEVTLERLLGARDNGFAEQPAPTVPFLEKAFPRQVFQRAASVRAHIMQTAAAHDQPFFLTALASVIARFGRFKRDGGWPRLTDTSPEPPSHLWSEFTAACESMIADLDSVEQSPPLPAGIVESRSFNGRIRFGPVDYVLCSPPYLNRHDYTRLFAPELAVLGVDSNEQLMRLRYQSLRSHVEAKGKQPTHRATVSSQLSSILETIRRRSYDGTRSVRLVEGYTSDLADFLAVASRALVAGGRMGVIISDVRFAGVTIPLGDLLPEIACTGLRFEERWRLRYRGNSSQQMAAYGRDPATEWALFWRKH